jgi:peptidoglycan/xylan/chitin deacetylase (PgdA/CDA1 family)
VKSKIKKIKINKFELILVAVGLLILLMIGLIIKEKISLGRVVLEKKNEEEIKIIPTMTITPTLTATPTAKPISFEDMNAKYGPCAKVSVLMYHHIEEEVVAKSKGQANLNVTPEFFRKQMQYLKDKNYNVIGMADLKNFFDNGTVLPQKSVLITLDDGYKDNYEKAYPILKEFGYRATIFIPTGLLNNPDYLTWGDLDTMKDLVYLGNHTWSHHSSGGTEEKQDQEIGMADKQLNEYGLNNLKIFAYPYGNPSGNAEKILKKDGYEIAFTTIRGNIMCKGQSLELPRIRIGNSLLSSYGL